MNFVDNLNFEFCRGRHIANGVAQFANMIHAIVTGSIDFNNIQVAAFGDINAGLALAARVLIFSVGAKQSFGNDSCGGCFCSSPWTC